MVPARCGYKAGLGPGMPGGQCRNRPLPSAMGPRQTFQRWPARPAAAGFFLKRTRSQRAWLLRRALLLTACPCFKTGVQKSLYTPAAHKIFCTPVFCCGARWNDAAANRVHGWPAHARPFAGAHRADAGWALTAKMSALLRCLAGAGLLLFAAAGGAVGAVAAAAAGKAAVFADKDHRAGDASQHQPLKLKYRQSPWENAPFSRRPRRGGKGGRLRRHGKTD